MYAGPSRIVQPKSPRASVVDDADRSITAARAAATTIRTSLVVPQTRGGRRLSFWFGREQQWALALRAHCCFVPEAEALLLCRRSGSLDRHQLKVQLVAVRATKQAIAASRSSKTSPVAKRSSRMLLTT